jgi:hypothetical protein
LQLGFWKESDKFRVDIWRGESLPHTRPCLSQDTSERRTLVMGTQGTHPCHGEIRPSCLAVDYKRVGFEALHFLQPGIGGPSRGIVHHTSAVESQSHAWQLIPPLSQTTLRGLLTALHQLGSSVHLDRRQQGDEGRVNTTAPL